MSHPNKCFACNRKLKDGKSFLVDTRDDQKVFVGSDCYRKIKEAGDEGISFNYCKMKLYPLASAEI